MLSVTLSSVLVSLLSFVLMTALIRFSDITTVKGKLNNELGSSDASIGLEGHTPEEDQLLADVPTNFTFLQCGDNPKSLPIQIRKFSIKPDPVVLPGVIKFKVSIRVKEEVIGPIKANIQLKKHTAEGWYNVPCNEAGYGSCQYPDVCPSLKTIEPLCPKEVKEKGHNCRCPLQPGKYSYKTLTLPVEVELIEGPFRIVAEFTSESDRLLACLDATMILGKGKLPEVAPSHGEL